VLFFRLLSFPHTFFRYDLVHKRGRPIDSFHSCHPNQEEMLSRSAPQSCEKNFFAASFVSAQGELPPLCKEPFSVFLSIALPPKEKMVFDFTYPFLRLLPTQFSESWSCVSPESPPLPSCFFDGPRCVFSFPGVYRWQLFRFRDPPLLFKSPCMKRNASYVLTLHLFPS